MGVGHLVLLDERAHFVGRARIERDAHHDQPAAAIFVVQLLQVGDRCAARSAPSRPKVHQVHLVLLAAELDLLAVEVFEGHLRHFLPDAQLRTGRHRRVQKHG
jgi:hypothetical protein